MTNDDPIIERLDLMVATLKLAYSREIATERERVRADAASAAILDATAEESVKSGDLQKRVVASTGVKARTVQRRLQELTAMGALRQVGSGSATAYRSTGLI
jgi:Fic family protein